jgi:small conductance mechanosensitive channel
MAPMIAGLGITGNVLGLALKDSIANFFAGFMIILNEPIRKNDYVELDYSSFNINLLYLLMTGNETKKDPYLEVLKHYNIEFT